MDYGGLQCHGCGSTNVVFDPKKRLLTCNQCGRVETYSRATLNANGKVAFSRDNAINFFCDGKFDNAQHYAREVLNIAQDNAPALFMMAYCDEYVYRKEGALRGFFRNVKDVALEYAEVQELKKLFLASAYNVSDYEEEIVEFISVNMQAEEDAKELCDFIDALCPYLIKKRPSINFLTPNLKEMYQELAGHCDIPKTCFALIKAIKENPDSPYSDQSFYLHAKAEYFYEHYILPIGDIINAMRSRELKEKFVKVYANAKAEYEQDIASH